MLLMLGMLSTYSAVFVMTGLRFKLTLDRGTNQFRKTQPISRRSRTVESVAERSQT